jgi:hypothetical protein
MSYGNAAALQAAVYGRLIGNAVLTAIVGTAIYDAVPAGALPETYISLGAEEARSRGDASGAVADHDLVVTVVSSAAGFATAKAAAAAVAAALEAPGLTLPSAKLMDMRFLAARTRRVRDSDMRRIDLRFRARVDSN